MLTDSHCHLASHKFTASEIGNIVTRAREAGVTRLVTLATCLDDLHRNLEIAATHPEVKTCLGIHPCDVHHAPDGAIDVIRDHLHKPQVCGIGETGLDYYHPAPEGWTEENFRKRQRKFLDAHFTLAEESSLPVVIHTRDRSGHASLLDALDLYRVHARKVRAVFHCFIGTREHAEEIIALGGLVSFGGVATFKNASEVLEVATSLPSGSFMVETDSPYLAPHPHRGTRNEPAMIAVIANHLAQSRGESLQQFSSHTTQTAIDFFRGLR
ncbi:MAG: TatD family hydrolase [Akkermansiaceae bacterium]|jgi:TatD DNase family protein|nr:TatD family hydrolase [Akkermansiaceae bacterium]